MTTQSTPTGKTPVYLSGTLWLTVAALLAMIFPQVKEWLENNPIEITSVLGAVNVLLRFLTSGRRELQFPDSEDKETASGTGETQESSVTRTGGHDVAKTERLQKILFPVLFLGAMSLVSCGHDVTLTPDGAEVCKGDSCLTLDKDHQTITYTQHTPTPPADQSVVVIQQSK